MRVVGDVAWTDISITEFLAHLRREPNPDDVLDWVFERLGAAQRADPDLDVAEDAILDARGMIEAYRDAVRALA